MDATDLTPEETANLIDYARRKYAEERWPLSADLRKVRAALLKLRGPSPMLTPAGPARPYVPSTLAKRQHRR